MIPLKTLARHYTVYCFHKDGVYSVESPMMTLGKDMTPAEGYDHLRQQDNPMAIYEVVPNEVIPNEGYIRNCSEEMAVRWLDEFDGDEDDVPAFIQEHLTRSEIEDRFASARSFAAERRSLSSPEATGRI